MTEFWSQIDLAAAKGGYSEFQIMNRGVSNQISHLLLMDKTLIFCRGTSRSPKKLKRLLHLLELNKGLTISKDKSNDYFSKG